ncbi:hypothetical protein V8E52_004347 [Russula decolorans]
MNHSYNPNELVVTYVDPSLGVRERRSQLVAWGFGQCDCERCVKEEREGRSCGDEDYDDGGPLRGGG